MIIHLPHRCVQQPIVVHMVSMIMQMVVIDYHESPWMPLHLSLQGQMDDLCEHWDVLGLICISWYLSLVPSNDIVFRQFPEYIQRYINDLRTTPALYDFPSLLCHQATKDFVISHPSGLRLIATSEGDCKLVILCTAACIALVSPAGYI